MGKRRKKSAKNTEFKIMDATENPRNMIVKTIKLHEEPTTRYYPGSYLSPIKQNVSKEDYYKYIAEVVAQGWKIGSKVLTRWNKGAEIVQLQPYEQASTRYIKEQDPEIFIIKIDGASQAIGTVAYSIRELTLVETKPLD